MGALADIYVQPSRDDAFPGATLEAMSVGKPTIAFRFGVGAEDCATDKMVQVDVITPAALAAAIERLADDPALRARLGDAGRRLVTERFNAEAAVGKFGDVLEALVARERVHSR